MVISNSTKLFGNYEPNRAIIDALPDASSKSNYVNKSYWAYIIKIFLMFLFSVFTLVQTLRSINFT